MATTVHVMLAHFTALGAVPVPNAVLTISPARLDLDVPITTADSYRVPLPLSGEITFAIPDATAGNGIYLQANVTGWPAGGYLVGAYPTGELELSDLAQHYVIDPSSLQPSPAGEAAWDATLALIQALVDQAEADVRARTVTATVNPADPDTLILSFPAFMLDPDTGALLLPVSS